jgi:hypothetical protein
MVLAMEASSSLGRSPASPSNRSGSMCSAACLYSPAASGPLHEGGYLLKGGTGV